MSAPKVEALLAAIQELANELADEPELIDQAIVVWESVSFADDGETQRCIRYTVPTDNFSLSGAIGLLEAGKHYVKRDAIGYFAQDDED